MDINIKKNPNEERSFAEDSAYGKVSADKSEGERKEKNKAEGLEVEAPMAKRDSLRSEQTPFGADWDMPVVQNKELGTQNSEFEIRKLESSGSDNQVQGSELFSDNLETPNGIEGEVQSSKPVESESKDSSISKFKDARQRIKDMEVPIAVPKAFFYWKTASRWPLILFAALAPIFFLPFTALPVAAHKEVLVFTLILASFFALLGRILIEGRIRYPGHLLAAALLFLVLIWGASSFFSVNQIGSLIGSWSTPDSFAAIFLFVLLAFSIVMTFDRHDIALSLLVFLASLAVLGVFELLQLAQIFSLPFSWAKNAIFNPIGSVNDLGVLLAFGLVIASGLMSSLEVPKLFKRLLGAVVLVLLLNLVIIDFWAIWVGLALAMIFLISFLSAGLQTYNKGLDAWNPEFGEVPGSKLQTPDSELQGIQLAYFQKAWAPSIILLISLIFLFIPSPLAKFIQTPVEVSLNFGATIDIAAQNLKSGHYFLGSGPNTFGYAFNLYKPPGINQTTFWQTVFTGGASAVAGWLSSVGVLGALSVLFLVSAFIWTGIAGTAVRNASRGFMNIASQAIFVGVTYLFIMWFIYGVSFTNLAFTFWGIGLFLAASLFFIAETVPNPSLVTRGEKGVKSVFKEIRIFTSPPKIFLFSLLIIGFMVGAAVGVYFETNRYIAEVYFDKAVKASAGGDNIKTEDNISKAIQFWPYDERYFQSLSQAVFGELRVLLARRDLPESELRTKFQNITTNALNAARQAGELNPKNPANAVLLGSIYENLIPFIADAVNFAGSSYSSAVSLDPKNPSHHLALARVAIASKNLDKAAAHLEEAINLKNDYAPARFLLVQVFDNQGKLLDAIKRAEELAMFNINDVGALFQLGFLYFKNSEFDKSRAVFEKTIELSQNYSNARYFLGLIYDKAGERDKAVEQFLKIFELNPDNNEVKQILANLKAKKPALTNIAPPAAAPQNRAEAPVSE